MTRDDRIALAVQDAAFLARFWAKVDKSGECWTWTGARTQSGYGWANLLGVAGRSARAHRVSWWIANGPIPPGLFVCHKCDNRSCVRPDHLFTGTCADNNRDMARKGRVVTRRGSTCPHTRLTEDNVREIRALAASMARKDIAARFGVGYRCILHIVGRTSWKHVQ